MKHHVYDFKLQVCFEIFILLILLFLCWYSDSHPPLLTGVESSGAVVYDSRSLQSEWFLFSISLSFLGSCICLRKSQYSLSSIRYFCPCLNCCICLHDNRGYMIIALLKYKYVLFYVLICADNHFFILVFCLHLHCLLLPSSASSCSLQLGLHIKKIW